MSDDRQAGIKGLNFYALLIGLLVVTQEGDRVLGWVRGFLCPVDRAARSDGELVWIAKNGKVSMPC